MWKQSSVGMAADVCMCACYLHPTLCLEMYVCVVHANKRGYVCMAWAYVCVYHFTTLSNRELLVCVCVCMYMHVKTAERLQLHKAVIFILIVKYVLLKIIPYSHTNATCNFINT